MRIHTNLTYAQIFDALQACQADGRVSSVVHFDVIDEHRSTKRERAFEVQLGSNSSESYRPEWLTDPANGYSAKAIRAAGIRRSRQGKSYADDLRMCATWHEWGHFIAEIFARDLDAIVGWYKDVEMFEYQTDGGEMSRQGVEWAKDRNGRVFDFMDYQARMAVAACETHDADGNQLTPAEIGA